MSEVKKLGPVTAYGIAVEHGFTGTEEEWLASLHPTGAETLTAVTEYFGDHPESRLVDRSVTTTKLASGAVTTEKLDDGAVTESKLGSGAVTVGKIANGAVTGDKIASGAVGMGKLGSDVTQVLTSPFNFKGSTTYANLPGSGNTVNDTYYVTDKDCRYSWTGSAWAQSSMDESDYSDALSAVSTKVGKALLNDSTGLMNLSDSTDYNGLKTVGSYECRTAASAATMTNCPTVYGHRIYVIGLNTNGSYRLQLLINIYGEIYIRYFATSESSISASWKRILNRTDGDFSKAVFIDSQKLTTVSDNTDYNSLTSTAQYQVMNSTKAATMTNCPTNLGHRLYVMRAYEGSTIVIQIVLNGLGEIFIRRRTLDANNGAVWGSWESIRTSEQKGYYVDETGLTSLAYNTDYDTVTTEGGYECRSMDGAKSMSNCPVKGAHRMYVTRLYTGSSFLYQIVVYPGTVLDIYVRSKNWRKNGEWSEWRSENGIMTPVYNQYNSGISQNVSRIKTGGYAVYGTLPYENAVLDDTSTFYEQGDPVRAVVYSSVWRDGLDVYRNLTLETFYSALANPASVLYTKHYGDHHISNAHSWYGGVCSTYVTKILGIKVYKTVYQLQNDSSWTPKAMNTIRDIALGDVLVRSTPPRHIAFVSQLYCNGDGALCAVGISEQADPVFRTTRVRIESLEGYLKRRGFTVMTYTGANHVALDDPTFNETIIFERGNNTYLTEEERDDETEGGAWFYIPGYNPGDASTDTLQMCVRSSLDQTENWAAITLRGDGTTSPLISSKVVNGVTLYDLSPYMQEIGVYDFRTASSQTKSCRVRIISTGTVTAAADGGGGKLTLSGWEGCTPTAYYVLNEVSGEDHTCWNPTAGYHVNYNGDAAEIDHNSIVVSGGVSSVEVNIPAEFLTGYSRWKVWVEYDTGSGLKQALSNLVVEE